MIKTKTILLTIISIILFSIVMPAGTIRTCNFPKITIISVKDTEQGSCAELIFESKTNNWKADTNDPLKEVTNRSSFNLKPPVLIYSKKGDKVFNKVCFYKFNGPMTSFYLTLSQGSNSHEKTLRYYELLQKPQTCKIILYVKETSIVMHGKKIPIYVFKEIKEENMICRIDCLE